MSKTEFIIIRHGQSVGNLKRVFLGHTDLDITELGYKQADAVCEYLKNEHIDVVYSSDLQRAYHTVEPIAKMRNLEVIKLESLREIYAGKWENQEVDYIYSQFTDDFSNWKHEIGHAVCTDGESTQELQERIFDAISKIAVENPNKVVCIGSHATAIRTFFAKLQGLSKDDMQSLPWPNNASVSRCVFEDGKFEIVSYGNDSFLNELKTEFSKNF